MIGNAEFKFHPIGQGCFYSGIIHVDAAKFHLVYDCGTNSPEHFLLSEIEDYKTMMAGNPLDLLMISHFHKDHVNGVFKLLRGLTCKNLIIPYYPPIERLILALTADGTDDDYIEFLKDPVTYLYARDYNIERIIIVGGPNDNQDSDQLINREGVSPEDGITPGKLILQMDLYDDEEIEDWVKRNEENKERYLDPNVKFLKKPYRVWLPYWEFVFYLEKYDEILLVEKVSTEIDTLIKSKNLSISDLFEKKYLKELEKIYKSYFTNLNNTSLVTYHGPYNNTANPDQMICCYSTYVHDFYWRSLPTHCCGTLLTGDIELERLASIEKLKDYYKFYWKRICYFQVPHHGSENNWNRTEPNGLHEFPVYIINHGLGRKKHPSLEVVKYINTHCTNGIIKLCNEAEKFEYGCEFIEKL
ncbi:ComEC/Rec2 family competence protein [Chryseobacterium daecheongense]|uniref:Uncharacterized protein n=1 Tax=Chryseobacterium daecheongense TaxID=192389 RepID=A0A3N0W587_9FLAO|nr:hypothetical protein [Chryseobacterium daecheongense]ROI00218.1 hypothetical protein EGI05_04855 [Chryseobacterium daecheongense]TDX94826.1 hypothetical protein BCF50_0597 [Chryseobacterium daecheongense]